MLDLDSYMKQTIDVVIFGETVQVKQPSISTVRSIEKVESNLTSVNIRDKRCEVALLILNNNSNGKVFEKQQIETLSISAIEYLIIAIADMKKKADADPN